MYGCGLTVMNCSLAPPAGNLTAPGGNLSLWASPARGARGARGEEEGVSLELVVELYLITLMCVVGLFGNVVTIVVLRRDKERRQALLLLQALAVADGLYLLVALLRYPLKHLLPETGYVAMQPVVFPLLKTFQTIAIWTMVLVTIDRFVYVCKPFHATQMFNFRKRRAAAVAVFVLGVVYNFPRFFESCVMQWHNPCTNITISRSVTKPQFHHALYYDIYKQGAYIVLLYVLPLVILAYMNARLVQAIHRSKRLQRDCAAPPSGPEYSENNATLVLVIVILVFIVCETPELFLRLSTAIERKLFSGEFTLEFSMGLHKLTTISELLMVINSSINFFIYYIFGRRFRKVMKETFTVRFTTSMTHVTHETIPLQRNQLNVVRANQILQKHVMQVRHTSPVENACGVNHGVNLGVNNQVNNQVNHG